MTITGDEIIVHANDYNPGRRTKYRILGGNSGMAILEQTIIEGEEPTLTYVHFEGDMIIFSEPDCSTSPDQCEIARRIFMKEFARSSVGDSDTKTVMSATSETQLEELFQESRKQRLFFRRVRGDRR